MINPTVYKGRSEKVRWIETIVGFLLVAAAIAGEFFFDIERTVTLVFVGLGALFVSKTKTLEFIDTIKKGVTGA